MGWKSSVTTVVNFEDVRVHKSNLVGNQGFKYAMMGLDGGRINIGKWNVGLVNT
jgi:alkylation response protein AidB-like acyl-CoA dehydrogenase